MDQTTTAHIVGFASGLLALGGITGITAQDISGFVNVVFAIISLGSFVWAHVAHKRAVAG